MTYPSGAHSYQQVGLESAVMSATPHQLMVMLFNGALSALIRARLFLEQGLIAEKGDALSKAINIIDNGLHAGLDLDDGDELAQSLASLYEYMARRLLLANMHNDVDGINEAETLLSPIADAWKQIGAGPFPPQDAF